MKKMKLLGFKVDFLDGRWLFYYYLNNNTAQYWRCIIVMYFCIIRLGSNLNRGYKV